MGHGGFNDQGRDPELALEKLKFDQGRDLDFSNFSGFEQGRDLEIIRGHKLKIEPT